MKQFIFIGAIFSCLCANAQRQEICFHWDKTLIPIYADQLTDSVSCQIYQDFEQEDHVYEAFITCKGNKILYDMEGRTLWADSLGYITLEGDILAASDLQPVYFDKGKDGFSNYIDSCYYNGPAYNHDEFQFSITFHLIFKEDMNIEEVRLAAPSSSKITPELRSYFVDCVFKTNGRWHSAEKAHGTYTYVQTCTFY